MIFGHIVVPYKTLCFNSTHLLYTSVWLHSLAFSQTIDLTAVYVCCHTLLNCYSRIGLCGNGRYKLQKLKPALNRHELPTLKYNTRFSHSRYIILSYLRACSYKLQGSLYPEKMTKDKRLWNRLTLYRGFNSFFRWLSSGL